MHDRIADFARRAREAGREVLLEPEALELAEGLGIRVPEYRFVRDPAQLDLDGFGERVVVKVVSPEIPHKSDVGGVAVVARDRAAQTIREMQHRLSQHEILGFLVSRFVAVEPGLAGELLCGLRWTTDFGAVLTFGAGGVLTEWLADKLPCAMLSAKCTGPKSIPAALGTAAVTQLLTDPFRGRPPRMAIEELKIGRAHV